MSEEVRRTVRKASGAGGSGEGVMTEFLLLLIKMAAIIAVIVLIFTVMFGIFRNADISMSPAIKDADLVFFYRMDKNYVKSDVLILKYQGKEQARRVIAVAGDTVDIKEDGLYLNGAHQQEPEIYEKTVRYDTGVEFPLTVGEGQVFVLGDGRENVTDSRVYGCVNVSDTLGKVMTIVRRRGI